MRQVWQRRRSGDDEGRATSGRRHAAGVGALVAAVLVALTPAFAVPVGAAASAASAASAAVSSTAAASDPVSAVAPATQTTLLPGSELNNPSGVAVDTDGNVYVADTGNHRVLELPVAGGNPVTLGFNVFYPFGIAVDPASNVYVIDGGGVAKLPPGGTQVEIGGGIPYPRGPAVDPDGNVYIVDAESAWVYEWPTNGSPRRLPFSGLVTPNGVVADAAGSVYVDDLQSTAVRWLPKGGRASQQQAVPYSGSEPGPMAVDSFGNLYVADTGTTSVAVVAKDGSQRTIGFTGLTFPSGVAVDRWGNVFTVDPVAGVLKLSPDVPAAPTMGPPDSGDGRAVVTWSAPVWNGGTAVTGYVVTPFLGAVAQTPTTFASTRTWGTVAGLSNGTTYTFRVAAINAAGVGPPSAPSIAVTVGTPGAPAFVSASTGDAQAFPGWFPSSANASPLTGYVITPYLGSVAQPAQTFPATGPKTVTGLINGSTYTFTVAGVNALGPGPPSAPSPPVLIGTPGLPGFASATSGYAQATVSWWPAPANGAPITGYVITPYVGTVAKTPRTFASTANVQTVTGLTTGLTYTFRITAVNAIGTGPAAVTAPVTIGIAPTAPGTPTVQPGDGSAKLTWAASFNNGSALTGYVVTPFIGAAAQPARTFASNATTQTLSGLANGTTYTFTVAATNAYGTSLPSGASVPVLVGAPAVPTFQKAVPGNGQATVSWWPPAANASPLTGYVIIPVIGSTPQPAQTFPTPASSAVVTGLTNNVAYTFRIAATNAIGTGPYATTAPITVGLLPSAPGTPTAQPADNAAVLTWTASDGHDSPVTGYVVTPVVGAVAQTPRTFASTATTQTITGLTNGTVYTFRIAGISAVGTGPYATTAPLTVGVVPTTPGPPSAQPGNAAAVLTWGAADGRGTAVTGYAVTPYVGGVAQTVQTFNSPATTQTVTGLANGTTYTFTVAGINAIGTGPASAASAPVLVGVPTAPGSPDAAPADGTATVTWIASAANGSPITSYEITPFVGTVAKPAQTVDGAATSASIPGLTNGATYTFRIAAKNAVGIGPSSTTAAVKVGTPARPGTPVVVPGNRTATISWTAPADSGAPITGYLIVPYLGTTPQWSQTFASTATTETVTGLVNGNTYTFWIAARNSRGYGPYAITAPVFVGPPALSVSAGGWHTCSIITGDTVECWGDATFGELGDGTTGDGLARRLYPVAVSGLTGVTAVAAGGRHSCALLAAGTVSCWGYNFFGQLGDGTTADVQALPVPVTGLTGVTAIAAGLQHTCALRTDGTVWCWGDRQLGKVGQAGGGEQLTAVQVAGVAGATAISLGDDHSCALLSDHHVACWGANADGQLGAPADAGAHPTPITVPGLTTAVAISAGGQHTCALLATATVACWGANADGQLGDGTTTPSSSPVATLGLSGVTAIASGYHHACAVLADATVRCWGSGASGQLGDGANTTRLAPVVVSGLTSVAAVTAGHDDTCALRRDGRVWCWGYNERGELGDLTNTDRSVPVLVHGL